MSFQCRIMVVMLQRWQIQPTLKGTTSFRAALSELQPVEPNQFQLQKWNSRLASSLFIVVETNLFSNFGREPEEYIAGTGTSTDEQNRDSRHILLLCHMRSFYEEIPAAATDHSPFSYTVLLHCSYCPSI
ncbi:hypothetical protein TNCV_2581651 [Trichonephila clavipes]|nr:hypothetical protein TNCV_2581651 [Trichonephila clavipes]